MSFFNKILELFRSLFVKPEVQEPERPDKDEVEIEEIEAYTMPEIVVVPGTRFKVRGQYRTPSKMARGLVVHYTVSGRKASNAKGVLRYLQSRGLGCPVMDEKGIIYIPENFDINRDYAYHAGPSTWEGKSGMSQYCIGMEICCWGSDKRGSGRRVVKDKDNVKAGSYQKYTKAQEESLLNFILWQVDTNPEFDVDWIVGHDEIAPSRKMDPGGSLSMTMPEFREMIREKIIYKWQ